MDIQDETDQIAVWKAIVEKRLEDGRFEYDPTKVFTPFYRMTNTICLQVMNEILASGEPYSDAECCVLMEERLAQECPDWQRICGEEASVSVAVNK